MSDLMLPVNPEDIHTELEHIESVIRKWRESINKGIVGVDIPAADAEAKLELFIRQFTGELLFVSGKCQNLAVILSER